MGNFLTPGCFVILSTTHSDMVTSLGATVAYLPWQFILIKCVLRNVLSMAISVNLSCPL